MPRTPSTPDTSVAQRYQGHEWIETIYTRTKRYRAVIIRDAADVHRVYRDRWDDSDWAEWGAAFWQNEEKAFADTIERARELARELLVATPDGLPEPL